MGLRYNISKFIISSWVGDIQVFKIPPFIFFGASSYKLKGHMQREIIDLMQPGDVFMRRYDSYIAGRMIPGFWSHCGVYVGDNLVLHASPNGGVIKEDVLTFFRTDYVAVLRVPEIIREQVKEEVPVEARKYLGTDYDYEFDFSKPNALSCTEYMQVLYNKYPGIDIRPINSGIFKGKVPPDQMFKAGFLQIFSNRT